jgi:hypothetical protein
MALAKLARWVKLPNGATTALTLLFLDTASRSLGGMSIHYNMDEDESLWRSNH